MRVKISNLNPRKIQRFIKIEMDHFIENRRKSIKTNGQSSKALKKPPQIHTLLQYYLKKDFPKSMKKNSHSGQIAHKRRKNGHRLFIIEYYQFGKPCAANAENAVRRTTKPLLAKLIDK
ncbi:hypothetical protein [Leminorella grimontii]|uniref:hypothetical protein n=1 Tax=Leminorella grimontii TaxID=82981 RepID=UPI000482E844|nr:hypothetical protein [Leminorella grimontii]